MKTLFKSVHLFSMIAWFGGTLFISLATPPMFRVFPREQAGDIMGAVIFPTYFTLSYWGGGLTLVSLLLVRGNKARFRAFLILVMLLLTIYSGLGAGREANRLRQEMKTETNPERTAELKNSFHLQHRLSFISLMTMAAMIPLVVILTARDLKDS